MNDKVNNAVEALDKLSQEEGGRAALAEVADRLAKLLGVDLSVQTQIATPTTIAPAEVEKTEFDVLLTVTGPSLIDVVKAVRPITGLGLKESMDLVKSTAERVIKAGVSKEEAKSIKAALEAAGATVVVR